MTFEEIVDQALAMLQHRHRVAYRTLTRWSQPDDDALDSLKAEITRAQRLGLNEDGDVSVWMGAAQFHLSSDGVTDPRGISHQVLAGS
jgi:hypothetical protein